MTPQASPREAKEHLSHEQGLMEEVARLRARLEQIEQRLRDQGPECNPGRASPERAPGPEAVSGPASGGGQWPRFQGEMATEGQHRLLESPA